MHNEYLIALSVILLSGVIAHWIGWLLGVPSILTLILCGLLVGPFTGLIEPAQIFGELLEPFTALAVSLILFEGGLSLNFRALRQVGSATGRICIVGPIISWTLISFSAWAILGFGLQLSLLLGALLIVTGPTVIIPILREIKPNQRVATVLRWEGILTDPIGALLSVMMFEAIGAGQFTSFFSSAPVTVLVALLIGAVVGAVGATIATLAIKLPWAPEILEASLTIALVICAYTVGNIYQKEAGLIAVTVMGLVLANQKHVPIRHIVRFKEHLIPLILSSLFIVLSAQVSLESLRNIQARQVWFLAVLIIFCRPASVFLATWRTELSFRERGFIALLAPRGIVALAVASIIGRDLNSSGIPGAANFETTVFVVVFGTVLFSSLYAGIFARLLGVGSPSKGGVAIVGAEEFGRQLAVALRDSNVPVILIDSNLRNIRIATSLKLSTLRGNILAESVLEKLEIDGFGYLIALTSSDELNALAVLAASDFMKRDHLFRIAPDTVDGTISDPFDYIVPLNCFPASGLSFTQLDRLFAEGGEVVIVPPTQGADEVVTDESARELQIDLIEVTSQGISFGSDSPSGIKSNSANLNLIALKVASAT